MRANRLYRIYPGVRKVHLARATASANLPQRALCGTPLRAGWHHVELRGDFGGREGDCGRCDRVLERRRNGA